MSRQTPVATPLAAQVRDRVDPGSVARHQGFVVAGDVGDEGHLIRDVQRRPTIRAPPGFEPIAAKSTSLATNAVLMSAPESNLVRRC